LGEDVKGYSVARLARSFTFPPPSLEGGPDCPSLRTSSEGWFIWSISSIWLVGLEIHPEEPDRPEKPANQTDKLERVARAQKIIRLYPLHSFELTFSLC
jgi:hypothetical protein